MKAEKLVKNELASDDLKYDEENNGYKIDVSSIINSDDEFKKIELLSKFSPYLSYALGGYYTFETMTEVKDSNEKKYLIIPTEKDNEYFNEMFEKVDKKLDIIKSVVKEGMSDVEKALAIHDYIVLNGEYDEELYDDYKSKPNDTNISTSTSFTSAGMIMNNKGVCDSYANAYRYIMNSIGVECYYVTGELVTKELDENGEVKLDNDGNEVTETVKHAWNLVKIGGKYYYVDCTADDPTHDRFGLVSHDQFLVGATKLTDKKANSYHDKIVNPSKFDENKDSISKEDYNDNLSSITSPVCFDSDNNWYYAYGENINNESGNYTKSYIQIGESNKISLDSWNYKGTYSGLILKDNELFYNTANEIRKYSLTTGDDYLIYHSVDKNKSIYGIKLEENNKLFYILKDKPSTSSKNSTIGELSTDKDVIAEYTITYELNGGTNNSSNPSKYVEGETITLKNPTKAYYTFDGWYSDSELTNKVTSIEEGSTGNKTLYAKWIPVEYTITYVLNGGTNDSSNPTTFNAENIETTFSNLKYPTRKGYTFAGWYTNKEYTNKNIQCKNTTLYAKWSETTYSIHYGNLEGYGINNSSNPTSYKENDQIILKDPTPNAGYEFVGWYLSDGVTKISKIEDMSSDITLSAGWTYKKYSINYELNGGTSNKNPKTYYIVNDTITLNNPTRPNYIFAGWYSDSKLTNRVTSITKGSTGDKTLYAKWTPVSYKITYNLNGGTNNSSNPLTYNVTTQTITLKNPTKAGYTFSGWYSDSKLTYPVTSIVKGSTGDKTLYAKWTPVSYKITYNLNGGTNNNSNPLTYNVTTQIITLNNPTRAGYTFSGWYSDSKLTNKVTSIKKGSTGNKTLYAKWTPITYKITYKLNKGTNNKYNPSTYKVTTKTITLKNPTRVGYTFSGWYSDSKCKTKVANIKKGSTGNKTLYAKWTKISVSKVSTPTLKNEKGNKLKVTFKAVKGVKEYEIQYSTDKNFKKSVKTLKTTKTTYTISKLTKNKTYYVRVRAKSPKKDSANKVVYGSYSSVKKLKITK
jgi:uncharacterized repeat protein (TIGR02543 family)